MLLTFGLLAVMVTVGLLVPTLPSDDPLALTATVYDLPLPGSPALVLLVLMVLPVAWRRRAPVGTLVVHELLTLVHLAGMSIVGQPEDLIRGSFFPTLAAYVLIYSVAAHRPPRVALPVTVAVVAIWFLSAPLLVILGAASREDLLVNLPFSLVLALLPLGLGLVRGGHLRNRATALQQHTIRAAALERGRLARELHDVVAHHLSAVVIRTAAERRVPHGAPTGTAYWVATTATDALKALDALVSREQVETGPNRLPGLRDLGTLLQQVHQAGLRIQVQRAGTPQSPDPAVDLFAYRILQEALTNTLRHAGQTTVLVRVVFEDDHLGLHVLDHGAATGRSGPTGGGHGLVGMRERVELLGGHLDVGPRQDGGWAVHARLPLHPDVEHRGSSDQMVASV